MAKERVHDKAKDATKAVEVQWGDGTAQVAVVDVRVAEPAAAALWMDLDRQRMNHLIRVLRRARDSAYGKDA